MIRVISLLRKPVEGSISENVETWNSGSINVDGSRVGFANTLTKSGTVRSPVPGDLRSKKGAGMYGTAPAVEYTGSISGRWPANLMLSHLPDCSNEGSRTIKRVTGTFGSAGGYSQNYKGGWKPQGHVNVNHDGTEQVEDWDCSESCACRGLDNQSGVVPTGGWIRHDDTAHPFGNAVGKAHSSWQEVDEKPGGASRFFKVFQETSSNSEE